MTTPEILRQAAKEVLEGWIRGNRHAHGEAHERVCALGGLENAVGHPWAAAQYCPEAIYALSALLPPSPREKDSDWKLGQATTRIAEWNNADDQTAENVAATMELAAICFEQAHAQPQETNAVDPVALSGQEVVRA